MNNIYIKTEDIPITKTRHALIKYFLNGESYISYKDKECTIIQCENGKFRSITEIHDIVCSRFPKTTLSAILKIITMLIDNGATCSLVYCTQINKVVVKYMDESTYQYITKYSVKHYYETTGIDGYSLKDYEQIINKLN